MIEYRFGSTEQIFKKCPVQKLRARNNQCLIRRRQVCILKKYFSYSIDKNKIKFGKCLICKSEKKVKKFFKMKDSNTSGLKKHLLSCHPKIYNDIYKKEITLPQVTNGQQTIDQAFRQVT